MSALSSLPLAPAHDIHSSLIVCSLMWALRSKHTVCLGTFTTIIERREPEPPLAPLQYCTTWRRVQDEPIAVVGFRHFMLVHVKSWTLDRLTCWHAC